MNINQLKCETFPNYTGLSFKAARAMQTKHLNTIVEDTSTGTLFKALQLSVKVPKDDITLGLNAIASDLNALADAELLQGCITDIISLDINRVSGEKQSVVVVCHAHVPEARLEQAKKLVAYCCEEGSVGRILGDLEEKLPPGDVIFKLKLPSHLLGASPARVKDEVDQRVYEVLSYLPAGTSIVRVVELAIPDVYRSFEVIYRNYKLSNIREIEICFIKDTVSRPGYAEEVELLSQINYIRR